MPNQYSKVKLTIVTEIPEKNSFLEKQYTKALFQLLKNKIPDNTMFVDELIKAVKKETD